MVIFILNLIYMFREWLTSGQNVTPFYYFCHLHDDRYKVENHGNDKAIALPWWVKTAINAVSILSDMSSFYINKTTDRIHTGHSICFLVAQLHNRSMELQHITSR